MKTAFSIILSAVSSWLISGCCGTTEPEALCRESAYGFQECPYVISAPNECYDNSLFGRVKISTTFENGQPAFEIPRGEKRQLWVRAEGVMMTVVGQVQEGNFWRTIWADTVEVKPGGEYLVHCQ